MNLASFDIFDTTLVRLCGEPRGIFYLTAKRLFGEDQSRVDYFCFWRSQAERRCSVPHATLAQIYGTFESDYFGVTTQEAVSAEMAVESENLRVNPAIQETIKRHRECGDRICFISDMYLSSDFLREVLVREQCIEPDEQIFVSCEHNASKAEGRLYKIVRESLKPSKWNHYGDNKHSDIKCAKRCGIKAKFVDTRFTDVEQRILKHFTQSSKHWLYSISVGYMRATRIAMGNTSESVFAADFIAPLYVSYVHFVLERAKRSVVERLYFLNRDSYILYRIAQVIGSDLDLRYLFVSRRSLVLPSLETLDESTLLSVFDKQTLIRKNLDSVLSFLKLSRADLEGYNFDFNKITTPKQQSAVVEALLSSVTLRQKIVDELQLTRGYLTQEGFDDGVKSACVDVGWLGSSRMMINRILRGMDCQETGFYYLGVRDDVLPMSFGAFDTYYDRSITGLTALIENYFSLSPYFSVVGYAKDENRVVPTFVDCKIGDKQRDITALNVDTCEVFATLVGSSKESVEVLKDISFYGVELLVNQGCKIDYTPLLAVSDFDSPVGKRVPFVKRLSIIELFKYSFCGSHITAMDSVSLYLSIKNKGVRDRLSYIHGQVNRAKSRLIKYRVKI